MEFIPNHIKSCCHGAPAPCEAACYFPLDIRGILRYIAKGKFRSAFQEYRNIVVFPELVRAFCDAPCGMACASLELGDKIDIPGLEQAMLDHTDNKAPVRLNLPVKQGKVAVIGAGISGLACVQKLASKGYKVDVYCRSGQIGGSLRKLPVWEQLKVTVERELTYAPFTLHCREIVDLAEVTADAVYIATGAGGCDFGQSNVLPPHGYIIGGGLRTSSLPEAVRHGANAALAIETYLKTGIMDGQCVDEQQAGCSILPKRYLGRAAFGPDSRLGKEEAALEADRCVQCDCSACYEVCDLMQQRRCYPPKLRDDVYATLQPDSFSPHSHARMVNSCTMCGACTENCPNRIDMESFFLASRQRLLEEGKQPPIYHYYSLQDLEHANSERARVVYIPNTECDYAFFPGCQLGASDPQYVTKAYEALKSHNNDVGLWAACCGAPALWSGDKQLFASAAAELKREWSALGRPKLIFACQTCQKIFRQYLPEITGVDLYSLWLEWALPVAKASVSAAAVFDPCSAERPAAAAVRSLARQAGITLTELPYDVKSRCCSFGGNIRTAAPELAANMAARNSAASELPYLTYCSNCRDVSARNGKEARHILEVMVGIERNVTEAPTLSQRRRNRERLAAIISGRPQNPPACEFYIDDAVQRKMDEDRITEDDLADTLGFALKEKSYLRRQSDDMRIAHYAKGPVTYWMEYRPEGPGYRVFNVYSHRLVIKDGNRE